MLMKISGWILFGLGVVLLTGLLLAYFKLQASEGGAGVFLLSGLGIASAPLVFGLLLLSKAKRKDKSSPPDA